MKLLSLEPESSASANSAIPAKKMVGRDGFEPSKSVTADLQSAPFGHSGTYPLFTSFQTEHCYYIIFTQFLSITNLGKFQIYCIGLIEKSYILL